MGSFQELPERERATTPDSEYTGLFMRSSGRRNSLKKLTEYSYSTPSHLPKIPYYLELYDPELANWTGLDGLGTFCMRIRENMQLSCGKILPLRQNMQIQVQNSINCQPKLFSGGSCNYNSRYILGTGNTYTRKFTRVFGCIFCFLISSISCLYRVIRLRSTTLMQLQVESKLYHAL
ncbi:hypothetical protein DFH27DRAFT_127366 [Peziza echinospora]|nr:hypothetical protein DFH27DRAFT_127366 [Peziza echinospora]